jgi:hypothetical protein
VHHDFVDPVACGGRATGSNQNGNRITLLRKVANKIPAKEASGSGQQNMIHGLRFFVVEHRHWICR